MPSTNINEIEKEVNNIINKLILSCGAGEDELFQIKTEINLIVN
jgi:hypothetical protein